MILVWLVYPAEASKDGLFSSLEGQQMFCSESIVPVAAAGEMVSNFGLAVHLECLFTLNE